MEYFAIIRKFVVESLDCIKKQHYPNLEIIIIDDCSTDGFSADLVQKYIDEQQLNCNYIRRKENKGISNNLNEIIRLSNLNSKYLVLLGDDLWDDNFLHTSVEILEKSNENEILVYSNLRQMDYESKEIKNIVGPFIPAIPPPSILKIYSVSIMTSYILCKINICWNVYLKPTWFVPLVLLLKQFHLRNQVAIAATIFLKIIRPGLNWQEKDTTFFFTMIL
ncbi:MAG: glycosyltransferase family 2 protein [Sphingobacteriales bacterium]|nr:glycosyltransferase family 2 protein [Sphingobacteriales bacterium]